VDKNELLRVSDRALLGITDDHPSFRIGAYTFGGARDFGTRTRYRSQLEAISHSIRSLQRLIVLRHQSCFVEAVLSSSSRRDGHEHAWNAGWHERPRRDAKEALAFVS